MKKKKIKREVKHLYKLLARQTLVNIKLQRDIKALKKTSQQDSGLIIEA
jgi:hypothetical protein